MKLYDYELSGNCYKIRLFLSLLNLPWQRQSVALGSENKTADFLVKNPLGQVPVLEEGELCLWDSQAILVYLARRWGPAWLPEEPSEMARIQSWLSLAANEIGNGPAALRRIHRFGRQENESAARLLCERVFQALEARLSQHDWLVGSAPTIADLSCYPYLALAHEGRFASQPFQAVERWFGRIEALPGYIPLPA